METIGGWSEIVHENTLICFEISKHLVNKFDLGNFVSFRIMFTYNMFGEMGDKKKIKFLLGDGQI